MFLRFKNSTRRQETADVTLQRSANASRGGMERDSAILNRPMVCSRTWSGTELRRRSGKRIVLEEHDHVIDSNLDPSTRLASETLPIAKSTANMNTDQITNAKSNLSMPSSLGCAETRAGACSTKEKEGCNRDQMDVCPSTVADTPMTVQRL